MVFDILSLTSHGSHGNVNNSDSFDLYQHVHNHSKLTKVYIVLKHH